MGVLLDRLLMSILHMPGQALFLLVVLGLIALGIDTCRDKTTQ